MLPVAYAVVLFMVTIGAMALYADIVDPINLRSRGRRRAPKVAAGCETDPVIYERRKTREVVLGHPSHPVTVGGDAPISVQSMTITKTADVEGTLQQIYALYGAGADIVRCTCNEKEAAEGLAQIVPRSPVPIVADIHHQYKMALAALEAGVHCLRLNPGNIRRPEHIKAVAQECKDRGVPDPHRGQRRLASTRPLREARRPHRRGHGRVGPAGAGLLRRGRLRRREDLGQGVERAADDRGLPPARRRSPTTRCTWA